jgi:ABC-2 type transport system ATP-binding protein
MSIIVSGLQKKYGTQLAVNDVSFTLQKGEIVGFLGPNGAGKSTTLKMITGYVKPDAGRRDVGAGTPIGRAKKNWLLARSQSIVL